jgi:single-strand DNA-binding protein
MYATNATVVGRLATDVGWSRLGEGTVVANFRVASTERRYDRATGGWVDGEKLFVDVRCWRRLADNAAASLVKGDPVVVTGRLFTRNYEHEGQRRSSMTLDANSVAANLSRCTATVTRTRRSAATEPSTAANGDGDGHRASASSNAVQANTVQANTGPLVDHDAARSAPRLVAAAPAGEA